MSFFMRLWQSSGDGGWVIFSSKQRNELWQCKCWCLKMDGLTGAEKPSDDCDQPSTRNGPGSNRNQSGPAGLIWPGSVGGVIVTILPQQPNGQLPRPDQSHWLQSHHLFQLEIRVLIHLQQSWETIIVPPKGTMKICGYLTLTTKHLVIHGISGNAFQSMSTSRFSQTRI